MITTYEIGNDAKLRFDDGKGNNVLLTITEGKTKIRTEIHREAALALRRNLSRVIDLDGGSSPIGGHTIAQVHALRKLLESGKDINQYSIGLRSALNDYIGLIEWANEVKDA